MWWDFFRKLNWMQGCSKTRPIWRWTPCLRSSILLSWTPASMRTERASLRHFWSLGWLIGDRKKLFQHALGATATLWEVFILAREIYDFHTLLRAFFFGYFFILMLKFFKTFQAQQLCWLVEIPFDEQRPCHHEEFCRVNCGVKFEASFRTYERSTLITLQFDQKQLVFPIKYRWVYEQLDQLLRQPLLHHSYQRLSLIGNDRKHYYEHYIVVNQVWSTWTLLLQLLLLSLLYYYFISNNYATLQPLFDILIQVVKEPSQRLCSDPLSPRTAFGQTDIRLICIYIYVYLYVYIYIEYRHDMHMYTSFELYNMRPHVCIHSVKARSLHDLFQWIFVSTVRPTLAWTLWCRLSTTALWTWYTSALSSWPSSCAMPLRATFYWGTSTRRGSETARLDSCSTRLQPPHRHLLLSPSTFLYQSICLSI